MTQAKLAKAAGTTQPHIADLESGKQGESLEIMARIAKGPAGVKIDDLAPRPMIDPFDRQTATNIHLRRQHPAPARRAPAVEIPAENRHPRNLFDRPRAGLGQAQKAGLVEGLRPRPGIGLRQAFGGIGLERRVVVEHVLDLISRLSD